MHVKVSEDFQKRLQLSENSEGCSKFKFLEKPSGFREFSVDFQCMLTLTCDKRSVKGAGRSADLKINKSAPLSSSLHTFSNTEQIYTK